MNKPDNQKTIVIVANLATFIVVATVYMLQPIFSEVAASFKLANTEVRNVFSIVGTSYALAFFLFGPLTDIISAKRLASLGALVVGSLLFVAARATDYLSFTILMGAAGAAAAAVPSAMFTLMAKTAPSDKVGSYLGMIIGSTVLGIIFGRWFSGFFTHLFDWQTAFTLAAAVTAAQAFLLFLLPASSINRSARPKILAVYAKAFYLFKAFDFRVVMLVGACLFFSYLGAISFLTFRLQQAPFLYNPADVSWISLFGLTAIIGAPLAGTLMGKLGIPRLVAITLGSVFIGLLFLGIAQNQVLVAMGLMFVFIGVFSTQPVMMAFLSSIVPPEQKGAAASIYLLTCLASGSLSVSCLGPLWVAFGWWGIISPSLLLSLVSLVLIQVLLKKINPPMVTAKAQG